MNDTNIKKITHDILSDYNAIFNAIAMLQDLENLSESSNNIVSLILKKEKPFLENINRLVVLANKEE